jgi:Putative peptidoglycan binding domain
MKHLFFLFLLCTNMAFAQSENNEFPFDTIGLPKVFIQQAESGSCYIFGYLPDTYQTTDGTLYKVYTKKPNNTPPICEIKRKFKKIKISSRFVRKPNIHLPKGVKLIDPVYKKTTKQIVISPTSNRWTDRSRHYSSHCHSTNLNFIQQFCWVEIPAQYENIITYQETKPAYKVIKKDTVVLDSASLFSYYMEANEFKMVAYEEDKICINGKIGYKDTLYVETCFNKDTVALKKLYPVATQLPISAVLIKKGGFSTWKTLICNEGCMFSTPTLEIQKALQKRGYDIGKIDGELNEKTKKALVQFQKDNGLPQGRFTKTFFELLNSPSYFSAPNCD